MKKSKKKRATGYKTEVMNVGGKTLNIPARYKWQVHLPPLSDLNRINSAITPNSKSLKSGIEGQDTPD